MPIICTSIFAQLSTAIHLGCGCDVVINEQLQWWSWWWRVPWFVFHFFAVIV